MRTNELGNYLREGRLTVRDGKPIGLVTASTRLGYNKNSVHAYELGKTLPDVQFLAHAAEVYKLDFFYLLKLLLQATTIREKNGKGPGRKRTAEVDPACLRVAEKIIVTYG